MSLNYSLTASAALARANILLPQWLPQGRWVGQEWQARNPRRADNHLGSFSINKRTGAWADFAVGMAGGDLISLYAYIYNISQGQACQAISNMCGTLHASNAVTVTDDRRKLARIQAIWTQAHPLSPTSAGGLYLERRGLTIKTYPDSLRWHDDVFEPETRTTMPALIAKVQNLQGNLSAIQRIYLTTHGHKAKLKDVKKTLGRFTGSAVRLAEATDTIAITEGIETGLAVIELMGLPVWATLSTIGMETVQLPPEFSRVYIALDHDRNGAGTKAAMKLAARLTREGRTCLILDPATVHPLPENAKGMDWLDVLNAQQKGNSHVD